jgi:MinD superfamily P-loop ATPase
VTFVVYRRAGSLYTDIEVYADRTRPPRIEMPEKRVECRPPRVIAERCDGCFACLEVCERDALVPAGDRVVVIETAECDGCGVCEDVCPQGALVCEFVIVEDE